MNENNFMKVWEVRVLYLFFVTILGIWTLERHSVEIAQKLDVFSKAINSKFPKGILYIKFQTNFCFWHF